MCEEVIYENGKKLFMKEECCPSCGREINECVCSSLPYEIFNPRYEVVVRHLFLLSSIQLLHFIEMEKKWGFSEYDDEEKRLSLANLNMIGKCE